MDELIVHMTEITIVDDRRHRTTLGFKGGSPALDFGKGIWL